MNKQSWSFRVMVRYAVFQVPEIFLLVLVLILIKQWVDVPVWFAWGLTGLWVIKDMILFPFVWRAYDMDSAEVGNCMVGTQGVTKDRLAPSGYIRIRGELWKAEVTGNNPPIDSGQLVRVQGISGLKLFVQADDA